MSGRQTRACVDSSVVIAAFAPWHDRNADASDVIASGADLVAHALFESYSVLTRLPAPFRAPAGIVVEFLQQTFPGPAIQLEPSTVPALMTALASANITGGAVYDALIGFTAAQAGRTLVTLDRRAARTYDAVGCATALL